MNMMPSPMGMPSLPPLPPKEMIDRARAIMEAVPWEKIEPILRTDERRNYAIDIETDSTVFEDAETEKAQRIEVMGAMTQWMERAIPAIQSNRSLAPLMKELTMFTLGAFKIGRQLEETFEDAFDQIAQMPDQPNPEQQKLEMEAKAKQAEMAMTAKDRENELAFKQKEHELNLQAKQAEMALKQQELEFKRQDMEFKRQQDAEKAMYDRQMQQQQQMAQQEQMARDNDMREREFGMKTQEHALKANDMQSRLAMDQDEQRARRAMEGEKMMGEGGKTARAEIEDSVKLQIQELATQFATAMDSMAQNQAVIVSVLQDIKANQDEVTDAVTQVVGHMTAPRKVQRDPKTNRAIGVEIGVSEGDLRQQLERLKSGGRQVVRDKMNRIEAFA